MLEACWQMATTAQVNPSWVVVAFALGFGVFIGYTTGKSKTAGE